MDFPATERTHGFYGHVDPAREAVAGTHSFSFLYEESHSSTRGQRLGKVTMQNYRLGLRVGLRRRRKTYPTFTPILLVSGGP